MFDCIEDYAPGFKESVVGRDILTPPDLERVFGLTGGVSIFSRVQGEYCRKRYTHTSRP